MVSISWISNPAQSNQDNDPAGDVCDCRPPLSGVFWVPGEAGGLILGADLVKNEITCQLRGAVEIEPEVDTVFEIGGQDAKYIHVREGHIEDFAMNKICAAGTGSFLEEDAARLDVSVKEGFTELAIAAGRPANLG